MSIYPNRLTKISTIIIVLISCLLLERYLFALTEEELNNLPKEKIKAIPAIEVMMAMGISEKEFYLVLEYILRDLKYCYKEPEDNFSQEVKKAIKLFQSDIGHKSNGILTAEQFEVLRERHNLISEIEIYPGTVDKRITKVGDYLEAEGTWVFENDIQADPLQTSQINCSRHSGKCFMATAKISVGLFHAKNEASLYVDIDEFIITKWTEYEIQAENDDAVCVSYTLSINPMKKEAFLFRRGKGGTNCKDIAESPQILKLEGGFKVGQEFWRKRNEDRAKVRSSKYQNLLQKF